MFGLECLVDFIVDANLVAVQDVIRAGQEFLYFLKVCTYASICSVLLSVDRAVLQGDIQL